MRFAMTADQSDLRAVVHDLVTELCPPATVRCAPDSAEVAALHRGLVDLGVPGLLVSEGAGGLGLDENHFVALMVECGWAAVPLPLVDTVGFAPAVLESAGPARSGPLGPDLAGSDLVADVVAGKTTCAVTFDGVVRFGHRPGLLLHGGFGGVGPIRVLDLAGASREPVDAVDPAADLRRIIGGTELVVVDDPAAVELAWLRGVLGASAQLIGLSRRMLETTVEYVGQRRQFGVPIGSFQAVKHRLADALLRIEFAAPAVARAGFSLATSDPDRVRDVSMAKALASDAAREVARAAIQCHGAIAYTTEYDLHLYAKRAWALAADWGSAAWHRAVVARDLGLPFTGTPAS
ncbi:acyl-CoA dehydrogenase family protein [Lentzea albidocapillata]|uniref:Acyl-CoA dehydrogenase, N-terminal domain n=1 Tax=Lentzea albidocapillata TaxID=40571 RepID=A0A1W2DEE7_9PSEU|nr:acyl-CoA dehydrogenase [Lentzea albidocapillata]SMC95861.1 Acyl-CoA dehydrogenase, N-terminal domain [Lentzea albidocapillata]